MVFSHAPPGLGNVVSSLPAGERRFTVVVLGAVGEYVEWSTCECVAIVASNTEPRNSHRKRMEI